ncbi:polysaccharide deacetylase family protein [Microbacterium sp. 3J1]|uniref:polysaccharide deacetylase family protein n=1 Tax=Microbacterium sp. 3J1 TaxID=861269 RepID=UPI000A965DA9|nr:polysaccharide deacetylase family protein [Microbacterium sp. 3J1]
MASGGKKRHRVGVIVTVVAVVLVAGGAAAASVWLTREPEVRTPKASTAAVVRSLTPAQQLIADAADPLVCAVTFAGDGAPAEPMLQRQDALYAGLPIPTQEGLVFAGWYASEPDAAAFAVGSRINGADPVVCVDQQVELFAGWKTPAENLTENARIPILMYHQFTANPEGESGWLRGNYAYIGDFDAQMNHIATTGFYLPTWDELSAFIDGRLFLPARSVIITDDDADQTWFDLAVPVIDRHELLSTSFMITAYRQDPPPSTYVLRRSHTHDMHQAGENGKGRMVNWTAEAIAADLNTSGDALGVREVIAYPFGHFDDTAKQGVALAGFEMARTIEPGYVGIGTDKLALPVVRIDYGMGLDSLIERIG